MPPAKVPTSPGKVPTSTPIRAPALPAPRSAVPRCDLCGGVLGVPEHTAAACAYVRCLIAGRDGLPPELVEALARDPDADVRRCIAERAKPLAVLIDGEWYVDA